MAIAPTGDMFKALEFDDESSKSYGVYITGEAVYNAPEKDVEMISIPGRNGSFAFDKGRFENIEVTYPAGIFATNESDFTTAISNFRNYLCSKKGYCRLTDDYNPDEYRMAVYKSGLEVTPAQLKAGEFKIVFECMPQRWLTSGEEKITLVDGDTVLNPTLFDASPMLEVLGYGTVALNGESISIENKVVGTMQVSNEYSVRGTGGNGTFQLEILSRGYESGDRIYSTGLSVSIGLGYMYPGWQGNVFGIGFNINNLGLVAGTPDSLSDTQTHEATIPTSIVPDHSELTATVVFSYSLVYDGAHTITITTSVTATGDGAPYIVPTGPTIKAQPLFVDSTQSVLGNPLYIDLDIGEAYKIEDGSIISVNNAVQMPGILPTLSPGDNIISIDDTITDLKIVPRWWKV